MSRVHVYHVHMYHVHVYRVHMYHVHVYHVHVYHVHVYRVHIYRVRVYDVHTCGACARVVRARVRACATDTCARLRGTETLSIASWHGRTRFVRLQPKFCGRQVFVRGGKRAKRSLRFLLIFARFCPHEV